MEMRIFRTIPRDCDEYINSLKHSDYPQWMREAIIAACYCEFKTAAKTVKKALRRKEDFNGEACYFVYSLFSKNQNAAPKIPKYIHCYTNNWLEASIQLGYAPARHHKEVQEANQRWKFMEHVTKDSPWMDASDAKQVYEFLISEEYHDAHPEIWPPEWEYYTPLSWFDEWRIYKFNVLFGILLAAIPIDFFFCIKLGIPANKGNTFVLYLAFFFLSIIGRTLRPEWAAEECLRTKVPLLVLFLSDIGLWVSETWGTVRMLYHGYFFLKNPIEWFFSLCEGLLQQRIVLVVVAALGCAIMIVPSLIMLISGMRNQD